MILLYLFLSAAGTSGHRLGVLRQQKCMLSVFWGTDVPSWYRWDKTVGEVVLPLEVLGEIPSHLSSFCGLVGIV